jgi:hypothetical protein
MISAVFCFNWLRGRGLGKSGGGRNNFVLYSPINYNWHFPDRPGYKKTKKNKNKNKKFHVKTKKNPGGLSNIPPYT